MSDTNYRSYADQDGLIVDHEEIHLPAPPDGQKWSDAFKLSHVTNSVFTNGVVDARKDPEDPAGAEAGENALDANRMCSNVVVQSYKLIGGRQCCIVVKGGCKTFTLRDIVLTREPGTLYDVQWDGFSDQSKEVSTGILDRVRMDDGSPVRVACGRGSYPCMLNGTYKKMPWESFKLWLWNFLKDHNLVKG